VAALGCISTPTAEVICFAACFVANVHMPAANCHLPVPYLANALDGWHLCAKCWGVQLGVSVCQLATCLHIAVQQRGGHAGLTLTLGRIGQLGGESRGGDTGAPQRRIQGVQCAPRLARKESNVHEYHPLTAFSKHCTFLSKPCLQLTCPVLLPPPLWPCIQHLGLLHSSNSDSYHYISTAASHHHSQTLHA
jgi:hypothetical protein